MALTVTVGVGVETDDREQLEARRKLLEEAADEIAEELQQIEQVLNPLAAHIKRWEARSQEHQHAEAACASSLRSASKESQRAALEIKRDRQDVQFRFWREVSGRAREYPWAMRDSAVREVAQHSMLRDLWQTVIDELVQEEG